MDHYQTLGVAKNATPEEIKKAYRRLASIHHPDKGGDTAMFQNIQTAYDENIGCFTLSTPALKGCYMLLDEPSVTGTANIVMAAVLAEGKTTIYNAACEPYLQQLCSMLNRMGAKISGIGSNLLVIEGVETLGGTEHRLLPDMIEIGSFIGLAAMTKSEITIKNAGRPVS